MTSGRIVHAPSAGPAPWVFVACQTFIAMLDARAPDAAVDALWSMTDAADPTIEELVGTIPTGSDASRGDVASFAIVRFAHAAPVAPDRSITAVARGRACVDVFSVGGARRFGAGGVEPWMLAGFRSVVAVGLYGDDVPVRSAPALPPHALPLRQAVLLGDRMLWAHPSLALAPEPAEPVDNPRSERPAGPEHSGRSERPAGPENPARPEAPVGPEHPAGPEQPARPDESAEPHDHPQPADRLTPDDLDRTVLRTDRLVAAARPSIGSVPDDDTVLLSRSGTRKAAAEHDLRTAEHDLRTPEPARFTLKVGGDAPAVLTGPVVIGRHPVGPRVPPLNPPALLTVPSPHEIVSSSHVRVEPQGDSVVVTDLRSTNGTFVTVPGQQRRRIHPGESFVVPGDASVDIGDGNIIEITPIVTDRLSGHPSKAAGGPR